MASVEYWFLFVIDMAVVAVCVLALADAVRRPASAFVAHGKLTKPLWTGILVAAILVALMLGFVGSFIEGFHVAGFWSAVAGAILYSIISWALSALLLPKKA